MILRNKCTSSIRIHILYQSIDGNHSGNSSTIAPDLGFPNKNQLYHHFCRLHQLGNLYLAGVFGGDEGKQFSLCYQAFAKKLNRQRKTGLEIVVGCDHTCLPNCDPVSIDLTEHPARHGCVRLLLPDRHNHSGNHPAAVSCLVHKSQIKPGLKR